MLLLARQAGTRAALYKSQFSAKDKTIISYMVSRGTGAAVVAMLPIAYGILNPQFLNIIFAVIISTIAMNGILMFRFRGNIEDLPPREVAKRAKQAQNVSKYV